jgi:putative component of toxin-antitoxin plasmid stabilization module
VIPERLSYRVLPEADAEIHSFGKRSAARIVAKINYLLQLGWREGLRVELLRDLGTLAPGIFYLRVKGQGEAYRVFCSLEEGKLVVFLSCAAKGWLKGSRLKANAKAAARRRAAWIESQKEEKRR